MAEPAIARDLLPEDAYDGEDPFEARLAVIERWVLSVLEDPDDDSRHLRARLLLNKLDELGDEALRTIDRITAVRTKARAAD